MSVIFPTDVLVVDDEPVVLQVVSRALQVKGLAVTPVSTGEAALEQLGQKGFGCLLTDKNLPGVDGMEVIRRATKLQPHCAIIVMTGYASTSSAVEALRMGATDYLEKPFNDLALVAAKVEKAIQARRAAAERDYFAERIRGYQSQLEASNQEVAKARTEIELFEQVLDARVRQATLALRADIDELKIAIQKGQDTDATIYSHAQSLLAAVREFQVDPDPALDPARMAFAKLATRIQTHIGLLSVMKGKPKK